ncbi:MAG: hypothetical protein QXY74_08090 [Candidatus Bathyarchaeia archaeon]
MAKRGRKSDYKRLLALWSKNPTKPLPFTYIQAEAQKMGYTKRTVINYLNQLVREKLLEKIVDTNRNTFYKPRNTSEVLRHFLINQIQEITDEEFLALLYAFEMACEIELAKGKKINEAFETAEKKILELWQAARTIRHAVLEAVK